MKIDLALKNIISAWWFINATSGMYTLSMREYPPRLFVCHTQDYLF